MWFQWVLEEFQGFSRSFLSVLRCFGEVSGCSRDQRCSRGILEASGSFRSVPVNSREFQGFQVVYKVSSWFQGCYRGFRGFNVVSKALQGMYSLFYLKPRNVLKCLWKASETIVKSLNTIHLNPPEMIFTSKCARKQNSEIYTSHNLISWFFFFYLSYLLSEIVSEIRSGNFDIIHQRTSKTNTKKLAGQIKYIDSSINFKKKSKNMFTEFYVTTRQLRRIEGQWSIFFIK